jgi:hypothetical protein
MGALGIGDQRHGRRTNLCQIGDFAGVIHPHFDDSGTMRAPQAQQRQRQANIVIQVAPGRQDSGAESGFENRRNHLLGRRLAVGAGHRDHWQRETGTPGRGQSTQRQAGIVDHDGRHPAGTLPASETSSAVAPAAMA